MKGVNASLNKTDFRMKVLLVFATVGLVLFTAQTVRMYSALEKFEATQKELVVLKGKLEESIKIATAASNVAEKTDEKVTKAEKKAQGAPKVELVPTNKKGQMKVVITPARPPSSSSASLPAAPVIEIPVTLPKNIKLTPDTRQQAPAPQ